MGHRSTTLIPVPDGALGWLGWQRPLLGVEHRPFPPWAVPRPDPDAIRARIYQEQDGIARQHQQAAHNLAFYRRTVWWSVIAVAYSAVTTVAMLVLLAGSGAFIGELSSAPESATAAENIVGWAVLFAPWFAVPALYQRRRLSARKPSVVLFLLLGVGLWLLLLLLATVTLGLSFPVVPGLIGLWALLSRPTVFHMDAGTTGKAPLRLWALYRNVAAEEKETRTALRTVEQRADRAVAEALDAYEARRLEHERRRAATIPFEVVPPPERQDIVAVGGSPAERGDMLHHLGVAAVVSGGRAWVLDLEGRGACDRLRVEARRRGRTFRWLEADADTALVAALDALTGTRGRRFQLTEALAAALADDSEGRVSKEARTTADTLNRLGRILRDTPGGITVGGLHAALEVLLGGADEAPTRAAGDDFGLDTPDTGTGEGHVLAPDTAAAIRAAFTRQDHEHFHAAWTELRIKLSSLFAEDEESGGGWAPDAEIAGATVALTLTEFDRELRAALLLAHHIELLRWETVPPPAALAVVGADRVRPELLRQLSEVAAKSGTQLLMMFTELTPAVMDLAKGRRAVAAFGGHGAAAAEELAELFGKDWVTRLQSYQDTWSESQSQSRAEAAGRNWSRSDSVQRTRAFNSFFSTSTGPSSPMGGGGEATHSRGHGTSSSVAHSTSHTAGGSFTETETTGTTDQVGGSRTQQIAYERRLTGSVLSALAPFTAVFKVGDAVAYIDVKADLPMPPQLTGAALPPAPAEPHPAAPQHQRPPQTPPPNRTAVFPQRPGGPHQVPPNQTGGYPPHPGPQPPPNQTGGHLQQPPGYPPPHQTASHPRPGPYPPPHPPRHNGR